MNIHNNTPFRHQVTNLKKKKGEILVVADLGWATLGEDRSELIEDKEREKQTCDDLETGSDWAWDWRWLRLRPAVRPCDGGGDKDHLRLSPWVRGGEESEAMSEGSRETAECGIWEELRK